MYYRVMHLLLLCPVLLFAQVAVSGKLSQDTRWSGVVLVQGDLEVPRGVTLTIAPGSKIRVAAKSDAEAGGKDVQHVEIVVKGQLIADGLEGEGLITFTSNSAAPRMHDWYGIVLKNPRQASLINNCVIEYASKGITCFGSSPRITNCVIQYNQYAAISCEVRSRAVIRSCTLIGNDFSGVVCELASRPLIENCIISQNSNGVVIFDQSQPDLGRLNPGEGESGGENFIVNNFDANIANNGSFDIYAQNNIWNLTVAEDIQETLVDQVKNPTRGAVLFLPYFDGQSRPARSAPNNVVRTAAITPEPSPEVDNRFAEATTTPPQPSPESETPRESLTLNASTAAAADESQAQINNPPDALSTNSGIRPATTSQIVDDTAAMTLDEGATADKDTVEIPLVSEAVKPIVRTQPPVNKPTPVQNAIAEPVIEPMLDGGKRQYVSRATPKYPTIYRKTQTEGKVFVKVIIGRDGNVESHQVLRTDGDLFTEAALVALSSYRYKPGTHKGNPVKFTVVEPFYFKLKK